MRRAKRRAEVKGQRWKAAVCSETHLSWIVSVSVAERDDVGSVRVCECLDGVLEKEKPTNETKKQHRGATLERSRPDMGDNEKPVRSSSNTGAPRWDRGE